MNIEDGFQQARLWVSDKIAPENAYQKTDDKM